MAKRTPIADAFLDVLLEYEDVSTKAFKGLIARYEEQIIEVSRDESKQKEIVALHAMRDFALAFLEAMQDRRKEAEIDKSVVN